MKNTKRLLMLLLALALLALTACAGEEAKNDNSGDVSADTTSAEENVTKVVETSDDIEQSDNNPEDIPSAEESAEFSDNTSEESFESLGESEESQQEEESEEDLPVSDITGHAWHNVPYDGEAYYAKELIGDIYRQWYFMEKAYYVKNADDEPHKGLLDDADAVYATAIEFSVNKDMELEETKAKIVEDLTALGIYVEWSYERGKYNGEERVYYAVYATQAQIEAVLSDNTNDNGYKTWLVFPLSVECIDLDTAIDYINLHDGGHKYDV